MKSLTFAKYVPKKVHGCNRVLKRVRNASKPLNVYYEGLDYDNAEDDNNPPTIAYDVDCYDSLWKMMAVLNGKDHQRYLRYEYIGEGKKKKTAWVRRSIGDLYGLCKTYFPSLTVEDLVVYLHKTHSNFYCFDAKKRVWANYMYIGVAYFPKIQPLKRDEYGMTRGDWKQLADRLAKLGYGKNLK